MSYGKSSLGSCQEQLRTILCLLYCAQELRCQTVHECRITRRGLWFRGCLKAWFFWVVPPRRDQDPEEVTGILLQWKCFDMLPNAWKVEKYIANVYAIIFGHVDNVKLLNFSVSCFCLRKTLSTKWNFCQNNDSRPRLTAVVYSLICFRNALIHCQWLV